MDNRFFVFQAILKSLLNKFSRLVNNKEQACGFSTQAWQPYSLP